MNELDMFIVRLCIQLRDNAAALAKAQERIAQLEARVAELEPAKKKAA